MDTKQFTNNFRLLLRRHNSVVKWRENVILAKNINCYLKLHSSELKLNISTSKNQLNIFTAEQLINIHKTLKLCLGFFMC